MNSTWQLIALAALLGSCASYPSSLSYHETAQELGDELLAQMQNRKDLRDIRLYIAEFQPCERGWSGKLMPVSRSMEAKHEFESRRFRHQLMGVLAPRMNVLESDSLALESGALGLGSTEEEPQNMFDRASAFGASTILMCNYAMDGDNLLVMLRVIDVHDRTILAAAEGLVPHEGSRMDMVLDLDSF